MGNKLIFWIITLLIIFLNLVSGKNDLIIEPYPPNKNYTEIKQKDARDKILRDTYDFLDFLTSAKISELNLIDYGEKCLGHCSKFDNLSYLPKDEAEDSTNVTDWCSGKLQACDLYKNPKATRLLAESNRFMGSLAEKSSEEERYQAWLTYRKLSCATCRCYCDVSQDSNKTSSFCLDEISSNVKDGYVISGVQLKVINSLVQIQYEEAQLLDNFIDESTRQWRKRSNCVNVSKRMNFYNRSLQLDDILLPLDAVVTGLSFSEDPNSRTIHLSVFGKNMSELTNSTIKAKKFSKPITKRKNLIYSNMILPTLADRNKTGELSKPDEDYIIFEPILATSDENTGTNEVIPFLDTQKLSSPHSYLSGLGIYWRSYENYGGFLAFKLLTVAGSN